MGLANLLGEWYEEIVKAISLSREQDVCFNYGEGLFDGCGSCCVSNWAC